VPFVEIHLEKIIDIPPPFLNVFEKIRDFYNLSLHSVGFSMAGADPVSKEQLIKAKRILDWLNPSFFSEHISWSGIDGKFYPAPFPFPYNSESLDIICRNIDTVQNYLGIPLLMENSASTFAFDESTYEEWEFINKMVERTGCKILLDISNLLICCNNFKKDTFAYLKNLNRDAVLQYHIAGYTKSEDNLLVDSHDTNISKESWELYATAISIIGKKPTIIEWDGYLPSISILENEAKKAQAIANDYEKFISNTE